VLGAYLKEHAAVMVVFVIFTGIFAGIFSLYELEVEAVCYASFLCMLIALFFFCFHFARYYAKHRKLQDVLKNIEILQEALPPVRGIVEADYQEMVEKLRELNSSTENRMQYWRNESIDYYMVWAHQIKTPISVMRLILQSEDTPEHEELLIELFRIEQYVEMVLSYFRLDSSSNDFVIREYDLDGMIRQVIRKYAPQFVRKQIRLKYEPVDKMILTDEKWFCFILEQIVSNAVKYTKNGSIAIVLEDEDRLAVSDTGIGIEAEDIPRIFERGYTGYNGRAYKKSTGLGLYLCKQAADKLSHRLAVRSEVGEGTTVLIDMKRSAVEIE